MVKTSVAEVKAKLSEFLDRALGGERIVICRHNTPIAELRALEETRVDPRPVGRLPGRPSFDVPATFFDPLPDEELELWEGGDGSAVASRDRRVAGATRVAESKATLATGRKGAARRRRS